MVQIQHTSETRVQAEGNTGQLNSPKKNVSKEKMIEDYKQTVLMVHLSSFHPDGNGKKECKL